MPDLFLNALFYAAVVLTPVSFLMKGRLPSVSDIRPELHQNPVQESVTASTFTFRYLDVTYEVEPVATYDLFGLVVSHNHINSMADMYHDKTSVDTKDIGVIWGDNVANNQFRRVKFWSDSWCCYYQYPRGVTFNPEQMSNNHLITDRNDVRRAIAEIRVGDQVHVTGFLVNYRDLRHPDFTRRSSLVRTDMGDGACEVIFVKSVCILRAGTHGWFALFRLSLTLLIGVPTVKLLVALFNPAP